MTSRERVAMALDHKTPDRVPCDFGGCTVTGMHVSIVYAIRQALSLDKPGIPVKVIDPFQMLGEITPDLRDTLGIDTIPLTGTGTFFGFKAEAWKDWVLSDGTPVLVPGAFQTNPDAEGRIYQYPMGDTNVPPSGVMPCNGHYFDAIARKGPVDMETLSVEENTEEFDLIPETELRHLEAESRRLHVSTDKAIFASFPGAGFGDLAWLPAPFLKAPKGLRHYDEWYMSLLMRPDFIHGVFDKQSAIALENLERFQQAVEDRIHILFLTGADYGMQAGPLVPVALWRELYLPYYRKLTDWIHKHTTWKVFAHSCGGVADLIPSFVEAGFDILNPVQTAAAGMEPSLLKECFGRDLCFWGGGVDTQRTLPYGAPGEIRNEVLQRTRILGKGGGFVFNAIHNIQPLTPMENVLAMFDAFRECASY